MTMMRFPPRMRWLRRRIRPTRAPEEPRPGNPVPADQVAAMFDEIAPVYDRMNTVMTLGSDRGWRHAAVAATRLQPGGAVVDLACGTGKLSEELALRVGPFGRVLGVDLSPGMIEAARAANPDLVQLDFIVANALAVPVPDAQFDAATIAFGLRNLPDFEAGFREMRRLVRPGGWVVCLELSMPRPRAWAKVYLGLFRRTAPFLGGLTGRRTAYRYLPDSLKGFPPPGQLAATMRHAGLVEVSYRRLALGAVALHIGRRPAAGSGSDAAAGATAAQASSRTAVDELTMAARAHRPDRPAGPDEHAGSVDRASLRPAGQET